MHYWEYRNVKPLSAPMRRGCYIFMIAVLDGVESLPLEHMIWLYLHPIPHCRAQRFTGCASVQVMNEALFSDALSCKVQIVNKIGLRFQQNLLKVNTNIVLYQNLVKDTILQI